MSIAVGPKNRLGRKGVDEEHLSIETLARWLAGDLEHEELVGRVIPHFLATCPVCRETYAEISRLKGEVEHWDERVAVFEGRQAPELVEELLQHPFEVQVSMVRDNERFQTWGLCQALLKRSMKATVESPLQAVSLAELAVRISELLIDEAYDPNWLLDLRAKSWGYLGNAFVLAAYRRQGIGSLLLRALLGYADEHGYVRVVLHPSERAIPLYERFGFSGWESLLVRHLPG